MGSSGEAGINAEAGVGLESLIRPRNSGYSPNCQAAASFQRDRAAEGGERAGGLDEDGALCCSIEQVRDVRF